MGPVAPCRVTPSKREPKLGWVCDIVCIIENTGKWRNNDDGSVHSPLQGPGLSSEREDRPGKPAVIPTRKEALLESEASLGCIVKPVSENNTGAGEMPQ